MDNLIFFESLKLEPLQRILLGKAHEYEDSSVSDFFETYYPIFKCALAVAGIDLQTYDSKHDFCASARDFFSQGNLFLSSCQHFERVVFVEQFTLYLLQAAFCTWSNDGEFPGFAHESFSKSLGFDRIYEHTKENTDDWKRSKCLVQLENLTWLLVIVENKKKEPVVKFFCRGAAGDSSWCKYRMKQGVPEDDICYIPLSEVKRITSSPKCINAFYCTDDRPVEKSTFTETTEFNSRHNFYNQPARNKKQIRKALKDISSLGEFFSSYPHKTCKGPRMVSNLQFTSFNTRSVYGHKIQQHPRFVISLMNRYPVQKFGLLDLLASIVNGYCGLVGKALLDSWSVKLVLSDVIACRKSSKCSGAAFYRVVLEKLLNLNFAGPNTLCQSISKFMKSGDVQPMTIRSTTFERIMFVSLARKTALLVVPYHGHFTQSYSGLIYGHDGSVRVFEGYNLELVETLVRTYYDDKSCLVCHRPFDRSEGSILELFQYLDTPMQYADYYSFVVQEYLQSLQLGRIHLTPDVYFSNCSKRLPSDTSLCSSWIVELMESRGSIGLHSSVTINFPLQGLLQSMQSHELSLDSFAISPKTSEFVKKFTCLCVSSFLKLFVSHSRWVIISPNFGEFLVKRLEDGSLYLLSLAETFLGEPEKGGHEYVLTKERLYWFVCNVVFNDGFMMGYDPLFALNYLGPGKAWVKIPTEI